MEAERWIATTFAVFLLSAGAVFGSTYELDIFGVFHDPTGKRLSVHHNERTAKPLLNERYVPTNFDALLIGGSSTSNFPMSALDFARFYNESIYGGNAVEEKKLVDDALRSGRYRFAIFVINPYIMQFHDFHEGIGSRTSHRWEALGSVNVLREEFYLAAGHLHHETSPFFPDGGQSMLYADPPGRPKGITDWTFAYDPIALEAARAMLENLRARGTRIIFMETPVYEPVYEEHRAQFDRFYSEFPLRKPGEPLIDFNAQQYAAFRADASRWADAPHLKDPSAALAAKELNQQIRAALPELGPPRSHPPLAP